MEHFNAEMVRSCGFGGVLGDFDYLEVEMIELLRQLLLFDHKCSAALTRELLCFTLLFGLLYFMELIRSFEA